MSDRPRKAKRGRLGKNPYFVFWLAGIFGLAVGQDYLYSRLRDTGFYLAESLLYNSIWLFFIPFTWVLLRWLVVAAPKRTIARIAHAAGWGLVLSFVHLLLFTGWFVGVSHLVFEPPHRFSLMFRTALANQFYLVLLYYIGLPFLHRALFGTSRPARPPEGYPRQLKLRTGKRLVTVPTADIQAITTDKPYTVAQTATQKFLDDRPLKAFADDLDPTVFLRVHRSAIVNAGAIVELRSRQNGDYDALLRNGQEVRFSRHYRANWERLLQ